MRFSTKIVLTDEQRGWLLEHDGSSMEARLVQFGEEFYLNKDNVKELILQFIDEIEGLI